MEPILTEWVTKERWALEYIGNGLQISVKPFQIYLSLAEPIYSKTWGIGKP